MNRHELKAHPEPFQAVWQGDKVHEIRRADRPFEAGDFVVLREWHLEAQSYTGRSIYGRITYLSPPGTWGLPAELCVFSVLVQGRRIDGAA